MRKIVYSKNAPDETHGIYSRVGFELLMDKWPGAEFVVRDFVAGDVHLRIFHLPEGVTLRRDLSIYTNSTSVGVYLVGEQSCVDAVERRLAEAAEKFKSPVLA